MRCCICGKEIKGYGNNPEGACIMHDDKTVEFLEFETEDRCCDECNSDFVIPGRLYRLIVK